MDNEDDHLDSDNDVPVAHSVDHRGDLKPIFDTPPMRHLIPIVQEILSEIRVMVNNSYMQDADTDSPVPDDTDAKFYEFILEIPTVHPLIAVLKDVLLEMFEPTEDSDEDSPVFIRWDSRHMHIVDVSPDHPLLPIAQEIIELFHTQLYGDEEDEDEEDEEDEDDEEFGDFDSDPDSDDNEGDDHDAINGMNLPRGDVGDGPVSDRGAI